MGQKIEAKVSFKNKFEGKLWLKEGSVKIGIKPNQASPYRLLQGALISCFHSTFLDVIEKKKITIKSVEYVTSGEKRDEIPSTIETLTMDIVVKGASSQEGALKAFELAKKYCSVYQTISQVGVITVHVEFID